MQGLYNIKNMLCDELDELGSKGQLSAGDLDTIHKLTDTVKNIDKIMTLEDEHSRRGGNWTASGNYGGNYSRGYDYDNDNSYGRHYVRGHYSRDDGKGAMMEEIDRLMNKGNLSGNDVNALTRAKQLLNM